MAKNRSQTRQRLIDAALELFSEQGFAATTTRQIAEQAQVNEVTLFRNFGSKQGLLLAVIGEAGIFKNLQASLANSVQDAAELSQALKTYARDRLRAIDTIPELLRSVVGEAAHYSETDRRQLGMGIHTATQALAQVLAGYMADQTKSSVTPMQLASLLNSLLFGYMVLELTTEFHDLWPDRDTFLEYVGVLCTPDAGASDTNNSASVTAATGFAVPTQAELETAETEIIVNDLPTAQVHELLQRAKKLDLQTYAIAYVLFAAGLTPTELITLQRSQHISNAQQHSVRLQQGSSLGNRQGGSSRQVAINQWILGKRYGSYTNNPLTQWLKSRKDEQPYLFLNQSGQALAVNELRSLWYAIVQNLDIPGQPLPQLDQARQTWCVEMLSRGMAIEDLSLLSGLHIEQLEPYVQRAREKAALERAIQLDQRV